MKRKTLEEMSLEELWQLFPIELAPHRAEWKVWASEEATILKKILHVHNPVITHVGSTAVEGILAKPIIDLLVEVPSASSLNGIRKELTDNGYICMSASGNRLSFNKGYTPEGYAERVFHIHIRQAGDNDEIFFRDYLRSHPDTAKEYAALKVNLAEIYRNNRDAYTEAKTEFVRRITLMAKNIAAGH